MGSWSEFSSEFDWLKVSVEHTNDGPWPADEMPYTKLFFEYQSLHPVLCDRFAVCGPGVGLAAFGVEASELLVQAVEYAAVELRKLWELGEQAATGRG